MLFVLMLNNTIKKDTDRCYTVKDTFYKENCAYIKIHIFTYKIYIILVCCTGLYSIQYILIKYTVNLHILIENRY